MYNIIAAPSFTMIWVCQSFLHQWVHNPLRYSNEQEWATRWADVIVPFEVISNYLFLLTLWCIPLQKKCLTGLHGKQNKECNHQTEKAHSLRQSETQDGVGEQLLLQRGVPVEKETHRRYDVFKIQLSKHFSEHTIPLSSKVPNEPIYLLFIKWQK